MFVDEKAKGEVPDFKLGTLKLSTAIRIGHGLHPEGFSTLNNNVCCAIGGAFLALGHKLDERWRYGSDFVHRTVAKETNTPAVVVEEASNRHAEAWMRSNAHGERLLIADWLESRGY